MANATATNGQNRTPHQLRILEPYLRRCKPRVELEREVLRVSLTGQGSTYGAEYVVWYYSHAVAQEY